MQKQIHLVLGSGDVGQILDGLEVRQKQWQNTALFLQTGESPEQFFLAEECSDAEEANAIAETYARIIETIRRQKTAQSGSTQISSGRRPGA